MPPAPCSLLSRFLDRLVLGGLLFLILFTPLAFGSVHPWAFSLMEATVFVLVMVWMAKIMAGSREHGAGSNEQEARLTSYVLRFTVPLFLFIGFVLFQLVPLPPGVLRLLSPSTYEVYSRTFPGWPERMAYSEWPTAKSAIRNPNSEIPFRPPPSGSLLPAPSSLPSALRPPPSGSLPVILPTLAEVKAGAPIPFAPPSDRANSEWQIANGKWRVANSESATAESSDLRPPTSDVPSPASGSLPSGLRPPPSRSPLPAPSSLLAQWLPLSLSPTLTWTDLLKFMSYAALFFLIFLYPFRPGAFSNPQSDIRNPKLSFRPQTSGLQPQTSNLRAPPSALRPPTSGSLLPAPCSLLFLVVLLTGFIVATVGFVQRFSWNGKILWFFIPYDFGAPSTGGVPRASGPFVNPDHFANYLSLILPLAISAALYGRGLVRRELAGHAYRQAGAFRIFCGLAAFLIFTGILLSLSRAGWMSALLGVTVLLWLSPGRMEEGATPARFRRRTAILRRLFIVVSLLLLVSLFYVGPSGREQVDLRLQQTVREDAGIWGRAVVWVDTLKMIRDFPLFGVGLGSWPDLFPRYRSAPWIGNVYREAHNDYIELLAETGIIGFLLLAWLFYQGGRTILRALSQPSNVSTFQHSSALSGLNRLNDLNALNFSRCLLAALVSALGVMALHEFFDFSLQIPANAFLFTVLFAMAVRIASMEQGAGSKERRASSREHRAGSRERRAWREEHGARSTFGLLKSEFRIPRFLRSLLPAPCSLLSSHGLPFALCLLCASLFVLALNQEMVPYPHDVKEPRSVEEARDLIFSHPARPIGHVMLARLDANRAPLRRQLEEYAAASWLEPTNPYIRDLYAASLLRMGREEEALREITGSAFHSPSLSTHSYLNGRSFFWLSAAEKKAVEEGFKKASAEKHPGAIETLAAFYERVGRFSDQALLYEEAAQRANDVAGKTMLLVNAGVAYGRAKAEEKAVEMLQKAISFNPKELGAYHRLVTLIYAPRKDFEKIQELVLEGIDNGADPFSLNLLLAEAAQRAGSPDDSKAALSAARAEIAQRAKKGHDPYPLYMSFADAARNAGRRGDEQTALLEALDLRPRSPDALSRLANLYLQENNFDRAALYLGRIASVNPSSAGAFFQLAMAEERRYRFAAADKAYARAIELAPENHQFRQSYEAFKKRVAENRRTKEQGAWSRGQRAGNK